MATKMKNNHPEVHSFFQRYPNATADDIAKEYPDIAERKKFLRSAVQWDDIRIEMSERILSTPAMYKYLTDAEIDRLTAPSVRELVRQQTGNDTFDSTTDDVL